MTAYRAINLALAFLLELAALAAQCYWGFHIGSSTWVHVIAGLGLPIVAAVLWGLFAAAAKPRFTVPVWFKAFIKVLVFGAAAIGLYTSGQHVLAIGFAAVVIVNTALIRIGHLDDGIGKPVVSPERT